MFANGSRYMGEYLHDLKVRRLCRTHQTGMLDRRASQTDRTAAKRTQGAAGSHSACARKCGVM